MRPLPSTLIPGFLVVSIHASVKDATFSKVTSPLSTIVSIHASVKDATFLSVDFAVFTTVSIHASVKDATFSYFSSCHA